MDFFSYTSLSLQVMQIIFQLIFSRNNFSKFSGRILWVILRYSMGILVNSVIVFIIIISIAFYIGRLDYQDDISSIFNSIPSIIYIFSLAVGIVTYSSYRIFRATWNRALSLMRLNADYRAYKKNVHSISNETDELQNDIKKLQEYISKESIRERNLDDEEKVKQNKIVEAQNLIQKLEDELNAISAQKQKNKEKRGEHAEILESKQISHKEKINAMEKMNKQMGDVKMKIARIIIFNDPD